MFLKHIVKLFFNKYVYMPEGDELREIMNKYKIMGFNGCIGSIDCTHVLWNKCPLSLRNYCIGKGKTPTHFLFKIMIEERC